VAAYACVEGRKAGTDWIDSVFAGAAALFAGYAGGGVLAMGNYGAINTLLIVLLVMSLTAGHDILAGIVWAFLMIKPQIGLLFAIPILMKRRFITAGVAVAVCIICSIPPCLMCGKTPVEMILEVPRGCAFIAEEAGTVLIPACVFRMLHGKVPYAVLSGISMSIGTAICFVLTWRLRKASSLLVFFAPAIVCSLIWNYYKPHDRVMLSLMQLLTALAVIRTDKKSVRFYSIILLFLVPWPFFYDEGALTKLIRRISLAMLVYGCWMIPNIRLFDTKEESAK
jgi:hypothetical protein